MAIALKRSTFSRFAACEREPRVTPQSAAAASSPYAGEPRATPQSATQPAPLTFFAPTQLFELRRCCGRLIFRKEYTVLFSPKRSTFSRFAACEREPRVTPQSATAASSPYILRTDSALRAAPVLRPAYFPKRVHRTLFSKTLDLQPLCGLRKGAEGNPSVCYSSQLPLHSSHRLSSSSCAGVAAGLFSEKSTPYSFLQNARPSAALRPAKGSRG